MDLNRFKSVLKCHGNLLFRPIMLSGQLRATTSEIDGSLMRTSDMPTIQSSGFKTTISFDLMLLYHVLYGAKRHITSTPRAPRTMRHSPH